jgi:hypothetical protein
VAAPLLYVPNNITSILYADLAALGIPRLTEEGKLDFHALRTTFINLVMRSGADAKTAQALARHANIKMTMDVYARVVPQALRDAADKVWGVIRGNSTEEAGAMYGQDSVTHCPESDNEIADNRDEIFDSNLRPPFVSRETLAAGFGRALAVKMNQGELALTAGLFGWPENPEGTMRSLLDAYPNVLHLVVTRAGEGAWWRTGDCLISLAPEDHVEVVDSVGAGDSVSARMILGLLAGEREADILRHALAIASFVCGRPGAMPVLPSGLKGMSGTRRAGIEGIGGSSRN